MNQIERIRRMEQLFDFASTLLRQAPLSQEKFEELREAVAILSEYYSSDDWKQDYAADEARLLPKGLKRGVLSQDGLWNLRLIGQK